jgi:hypothetical protein
MRLREDIYKGRGLEIKKKESPLGEKESSPGEDVWVKA